MEKMIKVGMMPGRIEEYGIEEGTTVAQTLEVAGLDSTGYDVKLDGVKVTDLNTVIPTSANLLLLAKQVKGASSTVKIGMMPGRIEEFGIETGTTVEQALELAGLDSTGYDIKIDGSKFTLSDVVPANASLILLAKQVKGATRTVKVGMMPGRIEEYSVNEGITVGQAIELAGLDSTGYDVKVDGAKVTDLSAVLSVNARLILLAKQVKGA